ncbi:MAG: hypothetical protein FJ109_05920 [Deltaproteobacteria bacterium]|nr:hypothetical protein [Deltaproteobacteria bacterium]
MRSGGTRGQETRLAALLAVVLLLAFPLEALAGKIEKREKGSYGTTLWTHLDQAPYPAKGFKYKDDTVGIFLPRHYCPVLIRARPQKGKHRTAQFSCYSEKQWKKLKKQGYGVRRVDAVDYVVHFHGHSNTVAKTFANHKLREQFSLSLQNAVLVVPQGPVNVVDSDCGKLESKNGLRNLLKEVHGLLQDEGLVGRKQTIGRVILTSHSGGYKCTAMSLKLGGIEVSEVFLFDSLYSYTDIFFEWLKSSREKGRRLINVYYREKPRARSQELMAMLRSARIGYTHLKDSQMEKESFARKRLAKENILFIETDLGHSQCTRDNFNYRDYLFSSRLKRFRSTDWFQKKGLDKLELKR